jgi:hypothetical protein
MADSNFRSYRSHDPLARPGDRAPARGPVDDPLAELARLIGQSDPVDDLDRGAAPVYEPAPPDNTDWVADERYAATNEPAPEDYQESYAPRRAEEYDDRYDPPRPAERPAFPAARELAYDPPADPVPASRQAGAPGEPRRYAVAPPPFAEEKILPQIRGQQLRGQQFPAEPLPAFLPRARDDRYEYDDQEEDGADDQSYAFDDEEDAETPAPRRRRGLAVIAAVLGLAVLGTAGAFAYRAMFGDSMLPSLPPIIKADTGPNKIMPSASNSQRSPSDQASGTGSGEKLVSREEKPVDVPPPMSTAPPRVVSTIPIFPAPDSPPAGALASVTPGTSAPMAPAPSASVFPAPPSAAPSALSASGPAYAPVASPEPKKIHTVAIRPDQPSAADAAVASVAAAPTTPPPARVTTPRQAAPPAAVPTRPAPLPQAAANAPMSILPTQGDAPAAAPPRTRTAVAQPAPLNSSPSAAAPAAGGSYAVQVTSQRSEADAQTAYRALRAKYPTQLGSQEPMVRRADLGSKGVFYRALVGPFASMEQAAGVCSSLKAAGGTCIVQRN